MDHPEPTISESAISDFVSAAQKAIGSSPQMNESNTKFKLIEPFLQDVLGWDRANIDREYSVSMATRTYNVDYALSTTDIPEVFVEAKGCDTQLDQNHAGQLQDYLRLQEVPWGLLTNGQRYRLFQMDSHPGTTQFHLIADGALDTLSLHRQAFSAISQPAIQTGDAEALVQFIRKRNRTMTLLTENKSELADSIAQLLTAETTDFILQEAEQEAKALIDRIVDRIQTDQQPGDTDTAIEEPPVIDEFDGPEIVESFPVLDRADLPGDPDDRVGVYASDETGVEFLSDYQAWGFISIASQPDYFMIYLTRPHQHIRYFGTVDEIIPADDFISQADISTGEYQYDPSKKVVTFSDLYRLSDPIPIGSNNPHRVQGLMYTTIGDVKTAKTIDDL